MQLADHIKVKGEITPLSPCCLSSAFALPVPHPEIALRGRHQRPVPHGVNQKWAERAFPAPVSLEPCRGGARRGCPRTAQTGPPFPRAAVALA